MKKNAGLRSIPALVLVGAMSFWSAFAAADPITVDFEVSGPKGGTLTGWFTGDDSTGYIDGILGHNELTAFEVIWSGTRRGRVGGFTHLLGDLVSLGYNIGSNRLRFVTNARTGWFRRESAILVGRYARVRNGSIFQSTGFKRVKVRTTVKVPEPGTLALFGIGLIGLGFARHRKAA